MSGHRKLVCHVINIDFWQTVTRYFLNLFYKQPTDTPCICVVIQQRYLPVYSSSPMIPFWSKGFIQYLIRFQAFVNLSYGHIHDLIHNCQV